MAESTPGSDHRRALGPYGTDAGGLIERTFRERIVLVGVTLPGSTSEETHASLDELELLVDTAGADVVDRLVQRRRSPDAATFIGMGKVGELRRAADAADADTVIFDEELTPAQQANLERRLGRTALDRTAVILDIFAQNAHSQEGMAQVELAQLRYRLPRLVGRGRALSQQAGGIGTRGPGETQLEIDRRRIVRRIQTLERDLRDVAAHRHTQGKARRKAGMPTVAIVGYTNAGKSTLLNALTGAGVLVEDRLFATLDPTIRRLELPRGARALAVDTVGFVKKLPHQLVEAFKSTLEVVTGADLLVHVVDGSGPDPEASMRAVREVLVSIGAGTVPELLAFNKADKGDGAARLAARHAGSVAISALKADGIDDLLLAIGDRLRGETSVLEVLVPYERGEVAASLHRHGEVLSEVPEVGGLRVRARLPARVAGQFAELIEDVEAQQV